MVRESKKANPLVEKVGRTVQSTSAKGEEKGGTAQPTSEGTAKAVDIYGQERKDDAFDILKGKTKLDKEQYDQARLAATVMEEDIRKLGGKIPNDHVATAIPS